MRHCFPLLQALYYNTTGNANTGLGVSALIDNTTGEYNSAVGYGALTWNTSGSYNSALGHLATIPQGTTFNNTTAIGALSIVNASNKIRLGDANVTVVEGPVVYTVSDGRFKNNISESDVKGLEFINRLRPVVYNFDTKKFESFLTQSMPDSIRN